MRPLTERRSALQLARCCVICGIATLIASLCLVETANAASDDWKLKKAEIEGAYGITISFDDIEFPAAWPSKDIRLQVVPQEDRLTALERLATDLSKYDPVVLRDNVARVNLYGSFILKSQEYGGTGFAPTKQLYLNVKQLGDTGQHADRIAFHHEFDHLLFDRHMSQFPVDQWIGANPPSFTYIYGRKGPALLASGHTRKVGDYETYERGFMCEYGQLALNEDVATYAEYLVSKPGMLVELSRDHPRVAAKAQLLKDFYATVGILKKNQFRTLWQESQSQGEQSWEKKKRELQVKYGISIIVDNLLAPGWTTYDPEWKPISANMRRYCLAALETDLSRYRPEFVRKNLSFIYLYASLLLNKQNFSATADTSGKSVYLSVAWLGDAGQHPYAMGFHDQFAWILYAAYQKQFPEQAWRLANGLSFRYIREAAPQGKLTPNENKLTGDQESYEKGLACAYGGLALGDDIGTYAQCMLAKPRLIEEAAKQYPSVARKLDLLRDFYKSIGFVRP